MMVVLIGLTLIPVDSLADAKAKRKNKCRNSDKRYYIDVCVNGKSCAIKPYSGWSCIDDKMEKDVSNFVDSDCKCDWYAGSGLTTAATARAKSTSTYVGSLAQRFTTCKRFKAGSRVESNQMDNSIEFHQSILNQAKLEAGSETYNYINNTITLNNFGGSLKIDAIDNLNEYAIFNFEIVRITLDALGNEVVEIISYAQAKMMNGQFYVTGDANVFSTSDFIFTNSGGILNADFLFAAKTIALNVDIAEEDEIEIRLTSDVGNIEDGPSEVDIDPVMIQSAFNLTSKDADITLTSNMDRTGTLTIRDAFGNVVLTQNNVGILVSEPKVISIPTGTFARTSYYVAMFVTTDGIIVFDKFVVLD